MNEILINISDIESVRKLGKALDTDLKLKILTLLDNMSYSIHELAEMLNVPVSTVAFNVNQIEEAGLISTELKTAGRGNIKICSKKCPSITIGLIADKHASNAKVRNYNMPVGGYTSCETDKPCGMALNDQSIFIEYDSMNVLYDPRRFNAGLIWFSKSGHLDYRFPNEVYESEEDVDQLEISFEVCSEAPNYRNDYKSDITVWINKKAIGTWTSPGDYGGRRGVLNPTWWPDAMTQYGQLKRFKVTHKGTYIDDMKISDITIEDIDIAKNEYIHVAIGVHKEAENQGGMNLFGSTFGDFKQEIQMEIVIKANK